ncbi:chromosome partitioning protein ParA [Pseudofulvibacter geojedonensis]|uniref:Chromosome partitioning protein ParA n=1 Tax=Pseudofulvibacter geojedonensis TaxID=1123758 RepID=A0ABW3HYP3_9FLAO
MSTGNNNGLKIGLGIAAVLLIGVGALFFLKNNELQETKSALNSEIENITSDLESLKGEYDKQIAENEVLNEDLIAERANLELTLDSLKTAQADVATLLRYKNSFFRMKKEKDRLFAENKRLLDENNALTIANEVLVKNNEEGEQKIDSLSNQLTDREKLISLGSEMTVAGVKGLAIIERSSGKQILTTKARKADKVKVCFAVAANKIAEKGDKELFIQVLDPNSNVIGENAQVQFDGKTLNYSIKTTFNYNNKALDICEYISAPKGGFEKGNYFINVFKGKEMIANKSFELE